MLTQEENVKLSTMTVCIAALADEGRSVVYCADKMSTSPELFMQVDRPDIEKIINVTDNCVVLFAGAFGYIDEVLKSAQKEINKEKHGGILEVEKVADCFRDIFKKVREQWVEKSVLEPKGLKFSDYISHYKDIPDALIYEINNNVTNFNLDAMFLVVGYNSDGKCHIYKVYNPGLSYCYDTEGSSSIGNAAIVADYSILKSGYLKTKTTEEVKKILLEAKKISEHMPGIGALTSDGEIKKPKAV
jgi:20S proteasome alpha/beta subunit